MWGSGDLKFFFLFLSVPFPPADGKVHIGPGVSQTSNCSVQKGLLCPGFKVLGFWVLGFRVRGPRLRMV